MLAKYFESKQRVHGLCAGPAGVLLEGFAGELWRAGYAESTGRRHIRAAEHLLYWAGQQGIGPREFHEQVLHNFDHHLSQCRCPGYGHADLLGLLNGARLFMGHLRGTGVITTSVTSQTTQDPALLTAFCQWMRRQRGTKDFHPRHVQHLDQRVAEIRWRGAGQIRCPKLATVCLGYKPQAGAGSDQELHDGAAPVPSLSDRRRQVRGWPGCGHPRRGSLASFFPAPVPAIGRSRTGHRIV